MTPDKGSTALPYYRWYVADYRGSLRVQVLSWEARAIYRELLDEMWRSGFVPNDVRQIAAIARVPLPVVREHWKAVRSLLIEVKDSRGQLLTSERLEAERGESDRLRADKARAGRAGGLKRAKNQATLSTAKLVEQLEQSKAVQAAGSAAGALNAPPPRCSSCGGRGEIHDESCPHRQSA